MFIRQLSVNGFKSLIHLESIELGRINCFIGANGVGKSNILEALGVLSGAASGVVDDESLMRRGVRAGVPRLYKSSFAQERTPSEISLSASSELGANYKVSLLNPLDSPEPAWSYKTETLTQGEEQIISSGVRSRNKLNPSAGLAALKMVEFLAESPCAQLLQALKDYAIYCPNTPTLRGVAPDQQSRSPVGLNGGALADGFELMRKHLLSHGEAGEMLLDEVLGLIDWVHDIDVTTHASGLLSSKVPRTKNLIKFTDRFMNKSRNELTAYDASEGALYVLFTAILCLLPSAPKVFAIDNLDQALNPRLVMRLVACLPRWLASSAAERQMLFTVHNPAVLDGLDLSDSETRLFVVERNSKGLTRIKRIQLSNELQALNKDYPLSRLWLMGHLGAVPNV